MADRGIPVYEPGEADRLPAHDHEVYNAIAQESDFVELRRRYRNFAFPATIAFMAWYILYIDLQQLGPRLHGHQGHREHQHRVGVGVAAIRLDLHHRLLLCPARQKVAGPAGFEATGRVRPGDRPMSTAMLVPLATGNRALTIGLFLAVVALTLYITFWASRQSKTAADYYAGGRSFSGFQNGLAVSGDYMSAASFLGISGAIALYGYDGFLYSIGFLVAWLVALLLIAELLRNSGRYTMADQLAYRMRQTPVRTAAATSTIVVSIFYLLAQMVGAGSLVGLLLGVTSPALKNLVIVLVGVLMIIYVTFGGMKGTTWVQIVKAVMLMVGTMLITFLVLVEFGFNLSDLLGTAAEKSGKGEAFLQPGQLYGKDLVGKFDFISLAWPWSSAPLACRTSSFASTPRPPPRRHASRCSGRSG